MNLSLGPVFIAGGGSLLLFGLYFFVRFGTCLFYPKLILSVLGLVLLDLAWYSKFLSNGPVLFFILLFGALVLWVWEGRSLFFLLLLYYLNIAILFYIDYHAPPAVFEYPEGRVRSVDIYLSFTLYSAMLIFLLNVVKREFLRQKEKAIHSDKLKSAFLANMSHEIRTPLNSIVGFSRLLQQETDPAIKVHYGNIIQKSSDHLVGLINDIIDLSIIEAGELGIKHTDFKLRTLLEELTATYSIELQKREMDKVEFSCEYEDEDISIITDYDRLKQVLSNLISNAIKFTSEGEIILRCVIQPTEIVFSVSDTGTGIPLEDQQKIFQRFTSINYSGMNTEGTGIGLSISEKIIQALNGSIWLESNVGKGSVFFISIPYVPTGRMNDGQNVPQPVDEPAVINSKNKILVVEDDRASRELIGKILMSMKLDLAYVNDGEEAINYIRQNGDISLILMDLMLPGVDGFEATATIKEINPGIPIIAQTAYAMTGDRDKAIAAGCDDYISKPLNPRKLQEMVSSYLK
jgi:signal transduction histidine kinase